MLSLFCLVFMRVCCASLATLRLSALFLNEGFFWTRTMTCASLMCKVTHFYKLNTAANKRSKHTSSMRVHVCAGLLL
jgi:hypothetical protein